MNIIKVILAVLGLIFGVMLFFWLFGLITSLLWYGFWIGLLAAGGYGVYRLFKKAENKYVGPGSAVGEIDSRDFNMSWDEYEKKYLHK
jgi:4-hydroxybenzoate polyprenyltransferase